MLQKQREEMKPPIIDHRKGDYDDRFGKINSLCCLVAWLSSVENSQMAWLAMITVRKDAFGTYCSKCMGSKLEDRASENFLRCVHR